LSVLQLSLQGDRRSCRPSGLHDELSFSAHRSWSLPTLRHDSRRAVQDCRAFASAISALDSRRVIHRARTCDTLRLRNSGSGRTRIRLQRNSLSIAVLIPHMRGESGTTDNRKTRFDSHHAPDCDLLTRIGRTLSHFVRTAHPCGLLFACSIAGAPDRMRSLKSPPAIAGGSVFDCNLPSACAAGSGKLAAIQTVSSSSSSRDKVVFDPQCRPLYVCRIFWNDALFPQHLSCANNISSARAEPGSQPARACCLLHESLPLGPRFTSSCRVSRAFIRLAPYDAQCMMANPKACSASLPGFQFRSL
jgi:hypothetical protein